MNKIKFVILTIIISSLLFADEVVQNTFTPLEQEAQHKRVTQLVTHILEKNHFKKMSLNDSLSSEIYDRFLEKLDYNRIHFLNSDIETGFPLLSREIHSRFESTMSQPFRVNTSERA